MFISDQVIPFVSVVHPCFYSLKFVQALHWAVSDWLLNWCRVIRIAPFANRLAMNVPPRVQFLRCLANNVALRFSFPVSTLARKLVKRMIEKSSRTGGKYVSVHLRFEEVLMVVFNFCSWQALDISNFFFYYSFNEWKFFWASLFNL